MNKGYFHVIAGSLTLFICVSVQAATSYTYSSIDYPEATLTYAYGIDGSNIVGYYYDSSVDVHGFQAIPVVPLPPAAWMALTMLGGIGGYGLIRRRLCPENTSL